MYYKQADQSWAHRNPRIRSIENTFNSTRNHSGSRQVQTKFLRWHFRFENFWQIGKMTDVMPIDPLVARPRTPDKIEWFEFLLNENLLEEHLSQESPDPSGVHLAVTFLRQSQIAVQVSRNIQIGQQQQQQLNPAGPPSTPGTNDLLQADDKFFENKRSRALKRLALKTLAFMKWDLTALESAPLIAVCQLLQEFLSETLPEDKKDIEHSSLELSSLSDEVVFALQLYRRWCLKTVVRHSFPKKPVNKSINILVPGLIDPNMGMNGDDQFLMDMIKDTSTGESVKLLEGLLGLSRHFQMPTAKCFTLVTDSDPESPNDWSLGEKIPFNEMACQISYDLGAFFMHSEQYPKAKENFKVADDLLPKLQDTKYIQIDRGRLAGYLLACGFPAPTPTLTDRLNKAKKENYKGVVSLFQEDNEKQELPIQSRIAIEDQMVASDKFSQDQLFMVSAVNLVKRLQENLGCPAGLLSRINEDNVPSVLKFCDAACNKGTPKQQENIRNFIRFFCNRYPQNSYIQKILKKYFSETEMAEIQKTVSKAKEVVPLPTTPKFSDDKLENLEWTLRDTYEPGTVKDVIEQMLRMKISRQSIINLSQNWYLPRDLFSYLESIPPKHGSERLQIQILIAKARAALNLENYDKARELLTHAEKLSKDISCNVNALLRSEILNVDVTQLLETKPLPPSSSCQEVLKRVKTAITALQGGGKMQPSQEMVFACVAFLLSLEEWQYFGQLANHSNGFVGIGRLIAALSQDLSNIKICRKAARELWEAVLLIFTVSTQQKRGNSGASSVIQRDASMGLTSSQGFMSFCKKIKNPTVISALISCLTKLYSTLQDDITIEISSDYQILWPTAVSSTGSLNVPAVKTLLMEMLDESLKINPSNISWLRTKADLCFAHNQYTSAMKYYLQAGVVATDFFSEPVPRDVYDDQIYKRMIKCCSYLQCYTQVAVLCQFADEPDYQTAFKAFQEKNIHDAMDTYYHCIWDITILEYLVNLHHKRGETEKKQFVIRLISQLELNASNPPEILAESAKTRKTKFLRFLAKQYL